MGKAPKSVPRKVVSGTVLFERRGGLEAIGQVTVHAAGYAPAQAPQHIGDARGIGNASAVGEARKRPRPDRFGKADRALFSQITTLMDEQLSLQEACRRLGDLGKIKKRGSLASAVLRLARRYRKEVLRNEI
jgi:hypothetical protein